MFKWIVALMLISCVAFAHEVCHLDRGDGCTVWGFHSDERYDHGHERIPCERSFVGRDDVECWKITNTDDISREVMSDVFPIGEDNVIGVAKNAGGDWEVAIRVEPPTPQPDPPTPQPDPPTPEPEPPTPEPEPPTPEPEPPTPEPEPPTPEPEPPTPEPEPPTPEPEPPTPQPEPPTPEPEPPTPEPEPPVVDPPTTVYTPPVQEPPVVVEEPPVVIEEPTVVVIEKPSLPTYQLRWSMTFEEGAGLRALPFQPNGWDDGNSVTFLSTLYDRLEPDVDLVANLRRTVQLWTTHTGDPYFNNGIGRTTGFYVEMSAQRTLELTKTVRSTRLYRIYYLKKGFNLVGVSLDSPRLKVVSDFFDVFRSVQSVSLGRSPDAHTLYREDTDELVSMLDADTEIEATQGYMLWCNDQEIRHVWGYWWGLVEEPQAAPGVERRIATMWGAIKVGK